MPSIGDSGVNIFGTNYVFHKVPYTGTAATFVVDQGATVAVCVEPASGPTATIAVSVEGTFTQTITLAAGGANSGGNVIIVTTHGKSVSSSKP